MARDIRHMLFIIGIAVKFIDGIIELVSSIILLSLKPDALYRFVSMMLKNAMFEKAGHFSGLILNATSSISFSSELFLAAYLLIHGIVKIGLVIALWKKKLWAYPAAAAFIISFMVYQIYLIIRFKSLFQMFLTATDMLVLLLIYWEYVRVKGEIEIEQKRKKPKRSSTIRRK